MESVALFGVELGSEGIAFEPHAIGCILESEAIAIFQDLPHEGGLTGGLSPVATHTGSRLERLEGKLQMVIQREVNKKYEKQNQLIIHQMIMEEHKERDEGRTVPKNKTKTSIGRYVSTSFNMNVLESIFSPFEGSGGDGNVLARKFKVDSLRRVRARFEELSE